MAEVTRRHRELAFAAMFPNGSTAVSETQAWLDSGGDWLTSCNRVAQALADIEASEGEPGQAETFSIGQSTLSNADVYDESDGRLEQAKLTLELHDAERRLGAAMYALRHPESWCTTFEHAEVERAMAELETVHERMAKPIVTATPKGDTDG